MGITHNRFCVHFVLADGQLRISESGFTLAWAISLYLVRHPLGNPWLRWHQRYFKRGKHAHHNDTKTYVLRCTAIGFKQKYGHRSSMRDDMNLRYKSEFTVEIGQYFVGRRSWDCVIWCHSCSYFYIKHHTLQKYFIETLNWRCNCIFIVDDS